MKPCDRVSRLIENCDRDDCLNFRARLEHRIECNGVACGSVYYSTIAFYMKEI